MATQLDRAGVAAILDAYSGLDGWTVYDEPPEQLAAGLCIVVAPRAPYQEYETLGSVLRVSLAVHVLAPRAAGPAMDQIDAGLAAVRAALEPVHDAHLGNVNQVGIIEDIGGPTYLDAVMDVTVERE